jgi:FlaA1/EpsC-like NDP-sugar epimerase/lipopolysaccharide/colanic/teichoic acid biosynthesis glycosyltransferase
MSKRLFDLVVSFIGLVVSSPFLLLCAILIKLDSEGSVFFKQIRLGKGKKLFAIYKFRTMRFDENSNGVQVTSIKDRRITKSGRWLRKFKLDELPQLWNVLKGDMSLVGPRPEVPKYAKHYNHREQAVFSVRPGITDLASIYYRDEAELLPSKNTEKFYVSHILHEKLKLNLSYIYNRSFSFDLKILFCTVLIAFFPTFTGKWLRASLTTGFLQQLFNSILLRIHHVDRAIHVSKRIVYKVVVDSSIILVSYYLAFLIRFDGKLPYLDWLGFLKTAPILVLISIAVFYLSKLYRGLWQYASIKELFGLISIHTLAWASFISSLIFIKVYWVPRSVLIVYWLLALTSLGGVRILYRVFCLHSGNLIPNKRRVIVVGAGDAGEMILRQMRNYPQYGYLPVSLVDDNPELQDVRIHGVPVLGNQEDIPQIVLEKDIHEVIVAIPSASATQMRNIVSKCERAGVKVKTVPGPREIIDGDYHLSQLREVRIEDLLEREPLPINQRQIASLLTGEFVLVTGAGGSIGQELCKQIAQNNPAHLILLDRSENSLFYLENDLKNNGCHVSFSTVVGDITDIKKCEQVFQSFNPKIIFHAAAHKHVPLMEMNPEEAITNNLTGTMNIAHLCKKYHAKHFVLISTDKAVAPTSIMGASKRLAELLIQSLHNHNNYETKFITVRFGNVLGSNGSVVTVFQKQIAQGGPVTITDPEMTRYFMTISEAVSLILYASTLGEGGEIFILDMGQPIKIIDIAKHLITLSGYDPDKQIPLQIVGKRPGEKLHENLWNADESPQPTQCKKIFMTRSNGLDSARLFRQLKAISHFAEKMDREKMYKSIQDLLPNYSPYNGKIEEMEPGAFGGTS